MSSFRLLGHHSSCQSGSLTNDYLQYFQRTSVELKVFPYRAITDTNEINKDQSKLQKVIDFFKDKWVDISDTQPILDKQVRREDKLEELDIF